MQRCPVHITAHFLRTAGTCRLVDSDREPLIGHLSLEPRDGELLAPFYFDDPEKGGLYRIWWERLAPDSPSGWVEITYFYLGRYENNRLPVWLLAVNDEQSAASFAELRRSCNIGRQCRAKIIYLVETN